MWGAMAILAPPGYAYATMQHITAAVT